MDLKTRLLTEARRHCAARGISLGRLAVLVVNDGKFFHRIQAGGDFGVRTYERFMDYFRDHAPTASPEAVDLRGQGAQAAGDPGQRRGVAGLVDQPAQHGDEPVNIGDGVKRRRVELGNAALAASVLMVGGSGHG